ncbi:MAG: hypothetical protein WDM80_06375 [Limisphaerales bacterium]
MKMAFMIVAMLLSLVCIMPAQTNRVDEAIAKPLPTMDFVLQQMVARAVGKEDQNDDLFTMNYQYNRVRTWVYRDNQGEVKSREEKNTVENKPLRLAEAAQTGAEPVPTTVANDKLVSAMRSNMPRKAMKVKNYSIPDLVKRFQFTLVGREVLNGRPTLVADFKPASDDLSVKSFADKFINQATGRVWVDEEDYAVAQTQLHLIQPVNVLGGLAGTVRKLNYGFTRARTPEGYWFARNTQWHLEGREVVINRIIDYHEAKTNELKIVTTATR